MSLKFTISVEVREDPDSLVKARFVNTILFNLAFQLSPFSGEKTAVFSKLMGNGAENNPCPFPT